MSGVEPVIIASLITAGATAANTALSLTQGGDDSDPVAPKDITDGELSANSEQIARKRALLNRRRGQSSLSLDPATGTAGRTGLDI